ncbi:Long chain acyl-synthetase 4 [Micractinium conductrix]|uniref:Long chain acyl-synthetase 4 n=1 Tax=Micractinium conductrix TaxID=554055 RepID=A0A2P6V7S9_9CHLO|nr:Long chain acyl-synthetase 4 [Micractinium conductrix]|eukprot:PSC70142.1 Long chain acyl-synthetase 4 [Micractinium conductrix]
MQACNRNSVYCVPLYDVLGDNTVEYIIDHSESSIVFCSADKLPVLARAMHKVQREVGNVVYWRTPSSAGEAALEDLASLGVAVHSFDNFVELGRAHPAPASPPALDDICTIMYTSGTTGTPKGVLLTHRAVSTEVASILEEMCLSLGATIGYWTGEAKGLPADIRALQPMLFSSVPKIFERFESTTLEKLKKASPSQRRLYDFAFKAKLAAIKAGPPWDKLASAVFDPLVFKEISRGMLGDRIRVVSSGGAPIATHVEEFMRVCGCAQFVQGYGLTETCAATFVTYGKEPSHMYTVGPPQPTFQVRLEAVPDMDYDPLGEPPRGEVLVRGGGLFSGYYKDEDETRKALDAEGFFHTGDVGELTPCGALRIIDRRKNIFKLSQGEYIAVEKIEGVLSESPLIDQVWVHGSRYESCLVAVVVPAKGKLQAWANEQGIQTAGWGELCGDSEVRRLLQKEIDTVGKQGGLKSFELPKAIVVACEPFAVANNLLTPTLELRRTALLQHFTPAIDALYAGMQKQEKREEKKAHGKHHSKAHALKTQAKYALKRLGRSLK